MSKLDDLESSLDELWMDVAQIKMMLESMRTDILARLDARDAHAVLALRHVERLVKDKEFLLRHIGVMVTMQRVAG